MRLLKGVSAKLLLSLLLIVFAVSYSVRNLFFEPLPKNSDYFINGLLNSVDIDIQELGIPIISAKSEHDLYFAMGFLHARDRLWQLELQKRIARGTLSEIFGKDSVPSDVWIRTLNLQQKAESSVGTLSEGALRSLQSYSAGINVYIESVKTLPFEFSALGITPEPWTPADSLAWIKVFALNLAGNYKAEIQRMMAKQYMGEKYVHLLFPFDKETTEGSDPNINTDNLALLLKTQLDIENNLKVGGQYVGSNAWAISGRYTKNGMPLLANDPHLGLQIPSLWYGVKQNLAGKVRAGANLVGLPVIIFGQNGHIAWGGTNMMADVQDLSVERVNPKNPNQYWYKGSWREFETRVETINIRPDFPAFIKPDIKPVEIVIKETVDGPVIRDRGDLAGAPITLHWTGLEEHDTSYEAFYQINKARTWQEFLKASELHIAPALNLLFSDAQYNIGYKGVGRIPVRKQGDGRYPINRSLEGRNWFGFIPFSEMPEVFNPDSGYFINANNKNTDDDYPYVISYDFAPDARAERIRHMLEQSIQDKLPITLELTKLMQLDTVDLSSQKLLSVMVQFQPKNKLQEKAINLLKEWNSDATKDSAAASIYYVWYYHLSRFLLNDELNGYWNRQGEKPYLSSLASLLQADVLAKLLTEDSHWCDIQSSNSKENCQNLTALALQTTLKDLSRLLGNEPKDWLLSKAQETLYKHVPFSEIKLLDSIFERRVGSSGAANTVNASGTSYKGVDGFEKNFGAGFRQIIQLSPNKQTHLFINSTGQSGQLMSDHYDDMVEPFENNALLDFTSSDLVHSFKLIPKQAEGAK